MSKKSQITISGLVIVALISSLVGLGLNFGRVKADTAGTSVTVGNEAPVFSANPTDSSDGTTPTNAGSNVSFSATATDSSSDSWKLLICKTNVVVPSATAPACDTGQEWCKDAAFQTSGSPSSCSYTTLTGDAESNSWYSFACDNNTSDAKCSTANTANSPFNVNHRPRFSYQVNDGPKNPNITITVKTAGLGDTTATFAETAGAGVVVEVPSTTGFAVNDYVWFAGITSERTQVTALVAGVSLTMTLANNHAISDAITEIGVEDTDSNTAADTVSLYVCKAADFTGTVCGAGGTWCSATAAARNPTCNFLTPRPDGSWNYYPYVIDSHNFASTDALQGGVQSYTVNNVAPSITESSISLLDTDEVGNLTLTVENGQTTGFKVRFTVVDDNSCQNISAGNEIASAFINVRRNDITQANCTIAGNYNANRCYPDADASWNPSCTQDTGTCSGQTDTDATWTCTFPFQYHTAPTVVGTQYAANIWIAAVQAADEALNTGLVDGATNTREMDTYVAYQINDTDSPTIGYGTVAPNNESTEAAGNITTFKARGNVGMDANVSGTQLCDNYPTCTGDTIAVGQQKYDLDTGITWALMNGDGDDPALSVTAYETEMNCYKTTVTGTPANKPIYWKIKIPAGQSAEPYTGENTLAGIQGESADWGAE